MVILSDGGQTHRRCTFLCAPSRSVYSATRSSGSNCLHVCPWWEYNDSRAVCAPVGRKQRSHIVPQPVSALHRPKDCFFRCFFLFFPKHNLRTERGAGGKHVQGSALESQRSYQGNLRHVQLNPLLCLKLCASTKEATKDTGAVTSPLAGCSIATASSASLPQSRPQRLPFHKNAALIKAKVV